MAFSQTSDKISLLASATEADLLTNLLPFWMKYTVDPSGGFYGTVGVDGRAISDAEKGSILNARILWTFSRAYRSYGLESYKTIADRAAGYFMDHFIDKKYGGVYWTLTAEGEIKDATKQTYANAFGIYGLAEHFRATGNMESLRAAIELYRTIEEKTRDRERQGYTETFERDWSHSNQRGVDGQAGAAKTMNTHIHVMEAYTALYMAWPDESLRDDILKLLDILQTKLYDSSSRHLILYCDSDWNPAGENILSFGHDVETSWLMCEAAEAAGDEDIIAKVRRRAVEMVDASLSEGLNKAGAMLYEKTGQGYRRDLSWWPQCETIIGCVNAWQITGNEKYIDVAARTWDYVASHFLDKKNGGWFMALTEAGEVTGEPKVSLWNCPYHNSRLAFELARRLSAPATRAAIQTSTGSTGTENRKQ